MSNREPLPDRIPSQGWRMAWVIRIGFPVAAVVAGLYDYALFGPPWATSIVGSVAYLVGTCVLLLGYVAMISFQPRWIGLSSSGLTVAYLFGSANIPWSHLRRTALSNPYGMKTVGFEDSAPERIIGSRVHWLTSEQAEAVTRFQLRGQEN